ncbi:trypsin-like peptidase domain-containing protein [Candidatus Deferrimicrobium sp.]|uniref:trypsin-like peptidase domain-containing protein n=1 Tax=Candidatus Deferrimicrobium sp. TaxID=3060586 RepID=UPI002ED49760
MMCVYSRISQRKTKFFPVLAWFLLSVALSPLSARAAEKADDLATAIIRVAKATVPAVVHIEVTERVEFEHPLLPFESDPFFRRFFGMPKGQRKFKQETTALGSGMIIDAQGHILTNHHVVNGATKIRVLLSDGREFPAKVVGTDPKTDLAVIRISAKGPLPHVRFGDSDKVEVGEWVVAIGHPRGLDESVTQGIISAKHRRGVEDPGSYEDFLQTDAAINPGNSGGPLLNLRGEVIGVNAAISSESGGFEGIGFTIPSNMALHVEKALIEHGKVARGWIGVSIQDLTPEKGEKLRAGTSKGALVVNVVPDGPAARGGLLPNDVVIIYDGKETANSVAFRNVVAQTPIGQEVQITVVREGKKHNLAVRIGTPRDEIRILSASARALLGGKVRALTGKESEKYGLEKGQRVVIESLDSNGPLEKAGLEVGDVILEVNGQTFGGMEGFVEFVGSMPHRTKIALTAMDHRTGDTASLTVVLR